MEQLIDTGIMIQTEKVEYGFGTKQDNQVDSIFEEKKKTVIHMFFSSDPKY